MVKSLADELTDILNWVENPGHSEHAREEANMGLVCFCRGLVCGLRGAQQVTGDTPISVDEAQLKAFKPDLDNAEAKRHRESENDLTCPNDETNFLHPADEVLCTSGPFLRTSDVSVSIDSKSLRDHS